MTKHIHRTLETSLPGAYARNLLIVSGDTVYQEPIILPDEGLKQSNRIKFRGVKELNANQPFTIFPNPAHDYFILKKNLPEMETSGIIRIVDQNGIIVKSLGYDNKADQILIKTTSLNPGVYLIRISNGTRQVSVLKLAIL